MAIKTFTTGEVLTAADTNTYLANSGLVYVTSATIGTTVSSVTVSSCFSSTYDNYLVKVSGGACSALSINLNLQLGSVTSGYKYQLIYGSWNNTVAAEGSTVGTAFRYVGSGNSGGVEGHCEIMSPFLTAHTRGVSSEAVSADGGFCVSYYPQTTSFTAFTLLPTSGTLTGGTITVYGYRKA